MTRRTVQWAMGMLVAAAIAVGCAAGPRSKEQSPMARREGMHARIKELRREIQDNNEALGLSGRPGVAFPAPRTDGGDAPTAPDAEEESAPASAGARSSNRCERICELADAICQDADEICQIADELNEPDARAACSDAQQSCRAAQAKCDRCR